MPTDKAADQWALVQAALENAIASHGPITSKWVDSAARRIVIFLGMDQHAERLAETGVDLDTLKFALRMTRRYHREAIRERARVFDSGAQETIRSLEEQNARLAEALRKALGGETPPPASVAGVQRELAAQVAARKTDRRRYSEIIDRENTRAREWRQLALDLMRMEDDGFTGGQS